MSNQTELYRKEVKGLTLVVSVVETHSGSMWLGDLYTATDQHQAGVTIQVPSHLQGRNCPKYYIGQYTPAELAKEYAKQGRENPSAAAYESLQNELAHYIEADDCYLLAEVFKGGIELADVIGTSFDWSYDYCGDIETYATGYMLPEYGMELEKETLEEAREVLAMLCECA